MTPLVYRFLFEMTAATVLSVAAVMLLPVLGSCVITQKFVVAILVFLVGLSLLIFQIGSIAARLDNKAVFIQIIVGAMSLRLLGLATIVLVFRQVFRSAPICYLTFFALAYVLFSLLEHRWLAKLGN